MPFHLGRNTPRGSGGAKPPAASAGPDAGPPPRPPRNPVRAWLLAILGLQVALALLLMGGDLARTLPLALRPSSAPVLTTPVVPGDQTRRFRPSEVAPRLAPPGSRPLPATDMMPSRLLAERTEWEGRPALVLTGRIAPGDAERLIAATDLTTPLTVFLNSPGGSVRDALALGRAFRAAGLDTALSSSDLCLSACPYILAGGVNRQVAEGAWVGVHQHFFDEDSPLPAFLAVSDIQRGQGEVMEFLIEMGIDPALMRPALMTPPDEIYLLLPEELVAWRLVTEPPAENADLPADPGPEGLVRPLARP